MLDGPGFLHLNVADTWPSFQRHGIVIAPDGALRLDVDAGGFVPRGVFRGGPFEIDDALTDWYRLHVAADPGPAGTRVQLFTFVADDGDALYDPTAVEPFAEAGWRGAPRDALDILLPHRPARRVWIGGVLRSDGAASPALHQMRLSYGRATYLEHLPAVYGRDAAGRDFLERVLTLFESVLGRLEGQIDDLPRLFSSDAAPHGGPPSWLAWLAGWLSFELAETWTEGAARSALAEAFGLQARRGTVEALRRYAKLYAGVEARILEPGVHAPVWMLGESSSLGVTTALAPGPPQGAVLGSTATLDASHLTRNEDFGAPLFEDLAHRFCVQVHCAELFRPGALDALRAILDRERPAHTVYHLCVLEPRMRVGSQATVGVDAVVAEAPMAHLGSRLGGTVLAETAPPCVAPAAVAGANPCPPDATEA